MSIENDTSRRFAVVREISGKDVILPVTSSAKPEVDEEFGERWQKLLTLMAGTMRVPAGLIMRLGTDQIEVCQSSKAPGNPYAPGDSEHLGIGLYCETVVARREQLLVPNALDDPHWRDNPDVKLDMIAYIGLPVIWPDGEVFGTICALDNKSSFESDMYRELIEHFRDIVESDLAWLMERRELKRLNVLAEVSFRESIHRIGNHLNMLTSGIQLKALDAGASSKELQEYLLDLSAKITAISRIQSELYGGRDDHYNLTDYLRALGRKITSSFSAGKTILEVDGPEIDISSEKKLVLGMVVSELITNSMKHAFHGVADPHIHIDLGKREDSLELRYRDNGPGFNPDDNVLPSVGMMLVRELPRDMGGTCEIGSADGMRYKLLMPIGSGISPTPTLA